MKLSYRVCIYPNSMNDGFTAIVSDLPGCVTCGDTIQEVFEMAVDAASGWVLTELEDGNAPPRSSEIATIRPDEYPDGFTSMLILDMDAYAEKYGEKAVRKKLHDSRMALHTSGIIRHQFFTGAAGSTLAETAR
ncbi:MAG: type II toxin-antitoxin system HicB family antitoxin [Ruminococcus sp.]|nr:type II toxin-antitoxin system HicB family antitoxin [Ruminococcus sp.]